MDHCHVVNISEKPRFVPTVIVTAFFEDDRDVVGRGQGFTARDGGSRGICCGGLSRQRLHLYYPCSTSSEILGTLSCLPRASVTQSLAQKICHLSLSAAYVDPRHRHASLTIIAAVDTASF